MGNDLPENYKEWVPRVSTIVSFFYPFEDNDRERFEKWVESKWVKVEEYMKEAQEWWTKVHQALEDYCITWSYYIEDEYKEFVINWIEFLKDYNCTTIRNEEFIFTDNYQWTIDLICNIDGEEWVLDWKNWGLAKHKWDIPTKYVKPYSKLKKTTLQLSLYAHAKWIKNIGVIELTKDRYYFHKLKLISKKEINTIIKKFNTNLL